MDTGYTDLNECISMPSEEVTREFNTGTTSNRIRNRDKFKNFFSTHFSWVKNAESESDSPLTDDSSFEAFLYGKLSDGEESSELQTPTALNENLSIGNYNSGYDFDYNEDDGYHLPGNIVCPSLRDELLNDKENVPNDYNINFKSDADLTKKKLMSSLELADPEHEKQTTLKRHFSFRKQKANTLDPTPDITETPPEFINGAVLSKWRGNIQDYPTILLGKKSISNGENKKEHDISSVNLYLASREVKKGNQLDENTEKLIYYPFNKDLIEGSPADLLDHDTKVVEEAKHTKKKSNSMSHLFRSFSNHQHDKKEENIYNEVEDSDNNSSNEEFDDNYRPLFSANDNENLEAYDPNIRAQLNFDKQLEPKDTSNNFISNFSVRSLKLTDTIKLKREIVGNNEAEIVKKSAPVFNELMDQLNIKSLIDTKLNSMPQAIQPINLWNVWLENDVFSNPRKRKFSVSSKIFNKNQVEKIKLSYEILLEYYVHDKNEKLHVLKFGIKPYLYGKKIEKKYGQYVFSIPLGKGKEVWEATSVMLLNDNFNWNTIKNEIVGLSWRRYSLSDCLGYHLTFWIDDQDHFNTSRMLLLLSEIKLMMPDQLKNIFKKFKTIIPGNNDVKFFEIE